MLGLRNASRSWIDPGLILKDTGGSAKICTKDAIDCGIINRISFWDALIVTAAESANCEKLWSADLNDGLVIRGVLIENPIKEET